MGIPNKEYVGYLALHALSNGVIITDEKGKVIYLNKLAEQLTGWKNQQAAGRYLEEVFVVYLEECRKPYTPILEDSTDVIKLPDYLILSRKNLSTEILISGSISPFSDSDNGFSGMVLVFYDVSHNKQRDEVIYFNTFHDHLTGLYNRAFFDIEMKRLDSDRMLPLSVVLCDANGLKLVNDAFGHDEGDRYLIKVAEILRSICRKEDIIARIGGDEFAILLPKVEKCEAQSIINRIRDACLQHKSSPIPISISIGAATRENINKEMKAIYQLAEERMYATKLKESRSIRREIINSIRHSLESHADETRAHVNRMKELSARLAARIGLGEYECNKLELLSMIHDIGKIAIPHSILSKPSQLSIEEWQLVRKHSEIGYRIAAYSPELAFLADSILSHHERWDGLGYPQGLVGKQIPLSSRIIAIIDSYDILTQGRAYRVPVSSQEALEEIRRCSGTQFDPELANHFISLLKESI